MKFFNTIDQTIKMKPIDVTDDSYAEYNEDFNNKDPKFKACDNVRTSKYKNIFLKDILLIGWKKFFLLIKLKIQFVEHKQLMNWMFKKLLEIFMKKNCKSLVKKNLPQKKDLKERVIYWMLNGKDMIIVLTVGW